ncbi:MAG: hypothetical protein AAFR96_09680 [Planctomycetota bacterium]
MKYSKTLGIIATAGLATTAMAQDSVSNNNAGDAIDPYDTSRQVTKFVVDLTAITSGKGSTYGVAPLLKAGRSSNPASTGFFSQRLSGQTISRHIEPNVLASGNYSQWNTTGQGVGPNNNQGAAVALPQGNLQSLAVAFNEFEPNSALEQDTLYASLVTFDPANPSRLFVDRIIAGTNGNGITGGSGGFAMGSIDTRLNLISRADGFNSSSGPSPLAADNVFRINAELRTNGSLNVLDNTVVTNAVTERVVNNNGTTHSSRGAIPEIDGGPATFGPDFNSMLRYDDDTLMTNAHFTPTFGGMQTATDHRGTFSYNPNTALGGVGIVSGIVQDQTGDTVALGVWGADATGLPQQVAVLSAPLNITDNVDSYGPGGIPFGEFRHYRSQMPFSGPIGTAAAGSDAQGNVLVAGVFDVACNTCTVAGFPVVYGNGGSNAPTNAIAVARFNPADATPTVEWASAGWVNFDTGFGKPIRDDAGNETGFLVPLNAFPGLTGPSISGVAMDAAGNLYFTSPFVDFGPDGQLGTGDDDIDTGLFRAIYDAASFGYELDLILQTGDVIASQGTGLNYNIGLIRVADGNSTDSGAFFGQSATYDAFPGAGDVNNPADPTNLGALAVQINITYDVNGDGSFDFGVGTGDEDYSTVFYVTPLVEGGGPVNDCNSNGVEDADDIASGTSDDVDGNGVPDECQTPSRLCADANNDGLVTPADFTAWILAFNTSNYRADQNNDGLVTPADFTSWILNFNLGVNGPLCLE